MKWVDVMKNVCRHDLRPVKVQYHIYLDLLGRRPPKWRATVFRMTSLRCFLDVGGHVTTFKESWCGEKYL